jgi:hypothetical protein
MSGAPKRGVANLLMRMLVATVKAQSGFVFQLMAE